MGEPMMTENRLRETLEEEENNGVEDEKLLNNNPQKRFWRSSSWSSSHTSSHSAPSSPGRANPSSGSSFPLTPRGRNRPTLPPLQTRTDEGKDWAPLTPRRETNRMKNGLEIKLDLAAVQRCRDSSEPTEMQMKRDKFAFFEKECSRVAEHIYLGSDAVARNRDTLLANKITHVLNCVGFICKEYFREDFKYNTLWLQDSPSEDITSILYDVFDYFEEVRELGGRVFVHCCQGVSRSTALVIAYLMWREGRSFEDAFQDVKAARGITNPNMGFACQLLQAQKRVHASPASPNSILRMYRLAPHSPYDALHLVPKTINNPSPRALDSRGAFVVHVPSSIFVWVGSACEKGMEKLAKAAADQVVRYERAQAPIRRIFEYEEPPDFWDAFSKGNSNTSSVEVTGFSKKCFKRVEAYDLDFELYNRALHGGVVPPSGAVVTHIPARDSGWSRLRKKFFSGSVKEKAEEGREKAEREKDEDTSGLKEDPSDNSLTTFSRSPTPSPSSSYSWSPASSDESSSSSSSSVSARCDSPVLRFPSTLNPATKNSSLAERRGGNTPSLFLGNMCDEPPPTPRFGKPSFEFLNEEKKQASRSMEIDKLACKGRERIYEWPRMKVVELSSKHELDSSSVYVMMDDMDDDGVNNVYVWVGRKARDEYASTNWHQVGSSFLDYLNLHSDKPCHVIMEGEETKDFWDNCSFH